ncbi:hypothetical protein FOA52_006324 [Chlamydomonas sp. UWO 241]|nr:hypothetical protein FOA52_006324 [Chlamydomonas sp. UWO 241]
MTREEMVASPRRGSSGFSKGASSFRGVQPTKKSGRWEPRVRNGGRLVYLGTHGTSEVAARVFDFAVLSLRGKQAITNFDKGAYLSANGALLLVEAALPGLGQDKHNLMRAKLAAVVAPQQKQAQQQVPPAAHAVGPPRDFCARSAALSYLRELKVALDEGALPLDLYQEQSAQAMSEMRRQ